MKKISAAFALFALMMTIASVSYADTYVNGYTRSNGTYVEGHYRSDANDTKADNWSTRGNTNPYTGKKGYK
ncbi:MAG: hypothetical protein FWF23_01410 [Alphaproteobacteria bacterium]|nr:hypothetical protein [Alphaproteobacteria bacterium]MCL2505418.1 hypothetical protein [Alphaproteobacteria bacterium]